MGKDSKHDWEPKIKRFQGYGLFCMFQKRISLLFLSVEQVQAVHQFCMKSQITLSGSLVSVFWTKLFMVKYSLSHSVLQGFNFTVYKVDFFVFFLLRLQIFYEFQQKSCLAAEVYIVENTFQLFFSVPVIPFLFHMFLHIIATVDFLHQGFSMSAVIITSGVIQVYSSIVLLTFLCIQLLVVESSSKIDQMMSYTSLHMKKAFVGVDLVCLTNSRTNVCLLASISPQHGCRLILLHDMNNNGPSK